jgi:hypothetical protein
VPNDDTSGVPPKTPQAVIDAIDVVAAHLAARGFGSAIIWPNRGTSFRLHDTLTRESELLALAADAEPENRQ